MSVLSLIYKGIGLVFLVLAAAGLVEKYRTVRRGISCPARILSCEKTGPHTRHGSGGYRYTVEFSYNGGTLRRETNDCFWLRHKRQIGRTVTVWFNPSSTAPVERKSCGTELLCAAVATAGIFLLFL